MLGSFLSAVSALVTLEWEGRNKEVRDLVIRLGMAVKLCLDMSGKKDGVVTSLDH